jgi:hypothetical protein
MAVSRAFAYNPSLTTISGATQVGSLAIATNSTPLSNNSVTWWNGPDESLGYVITVPVSTNTQPTPISGVSASVGFYRTNGLTDNGFISLAQSVARRNGTPQVFTTTSNAKNWLNTNGFWTSYTSYVPLPPVLYLDAGDISSYPGTGTVWTDLIGGKTFNLINGPMYDPSNGGKFYFYAPSGQYAECSTSLPSLSTFTTAVWHYWDGTNIGDAPCILTEKFVGGSINYFLGNLQGSVAQSGYFNGGFRISPQFTLTPNTWYYIVTTCDSSQNVKVYINNTLVSTTPTSGNLPSSGNAGIRLMRRWDNPDYWGGYLSEVAIYNQAITASDVNSNWNYTKTRYGY